MNFGKFLKIKREKKDLSMRKLAKLSNIDVSYVSRLEKGDGIPSRDVVLSIAKALNEDEDEFLVMAGYTPSDIERAKKVYTGEELEEKIPKEYKKLFKEENLKYIKFANEMLKEDIDPKILSELAKTIKNLNIDKK